MSSPDQTMPSLPMTGPSTGPTPRKLEQPAPEANPLDTYVVPARLSTLRADADGDTVAASLMRRRLSPDSGMRRL